MRRKGLSLIIIYGVLVTSLCMSFVSMDIPETSSIDPFFTLTAVVDGNNPYSKNYNPFFRDYLNFA